MNWNWNDFLLAIKPHIPWAAAGVIGRMIFHGREAQAGRRRFWGRELPFELLIAIGMAFVGNAVAKWFGLTGDYATAAAGVSAYLGPRSLDILFARFATKQG